MARPVAVLLITAILAGCKGSGQATGPVDPFFGRTRVEPPRTGSIAGQPPDPSYPRAVAPNPLRSPAAPVRPSGLPSGASAPGQPAPGTGWTPSPTRPAASATGLPQGSGGYRPADGSYAYRGTSQPSPSATTAGAGDRIVIPSTARDLTAPPIQPGGSISTRPGLLAQAAGGAPTPTMSRPTVSAVSDRERITRTLGPRASAAVVSGALPRPVDPAPTPSPSSPSPAARRPSAAFPNRVIDINDLPVATVSGG